MHKFLLVAGLEDSAAQPGGDTIEAQASRDPIFNASSWEEQDIEKLQKILLKCNSDSNRRIGLWLN